MQQWIRNCFCAAFGLITLVMTSGEWSFAVASVDGIDSPIASGEMLQMQPLPCADDGEPCVPSMSSPGSILQGFESYPDRLFANRAGARANERPLWGPAKLKILDPMEVPRITSLDNDDPNSIFYSGRPNFFNIAVDDEWDWNNLINTDRSDFTDTPFTMGEGVSVVEAGIFNTRSHSPDAHTTLHSVPDVLLRTGVTNDFELRFRWLGYQMVTQEDPHTGLTDSAFGGGDFDLGFKWNICPQKNWFPMSTLVAGVLLPTGTNGFSGNAVQPHFNFVQGWQLRRYLFLKHQFGYDYLTQPTFQITGPSQSSGQLLVGNRSALDSYHSSISCLYQATKHIGGFAEWFVLYGPNQQTTNFVDTGIFYYLTTNIQLDCTVGSSIATQETNTLFTKFGFSTRW